MHKRKFVVPRKLRKEEEDSVQQEDSELRELCSENQSLRKVAAIEEGIDAEIERWKQATRRALREYQKYERSYCTLGELLEKFSIRKELLGYDSETDSFFAEDDE